MLQSIAGHCLAARLTRVSDWFRDGEMGKSGHLSLLPGRK